MRFQLYLETCREEGAGEAVRLAVFFFTFCSICVAYCRNRVKHHAFSGFVREGSGFRLASTKSNRMSRYLAVSLRPRLARFQEHASTARLFIA